MEQDNDTKKVTAVTAKNRYLKRIILAIFVILLLFLAYQLGASKPDSNNVTEVEQNDQLDEISSDDSSNLDDSQNGLTSESCTKEFMPVCVQTATAQTQYNNVCLAEKAGYDKEDYTVGECEAEGGIIVPDETDTIQCPQVLDPVCGTNGVSYDNTCEAEKAGASVDHKGECTVADQAIGQDNDCPAIYDPVCGEDFVTYDNTCEAQSAGVEVSYNGACLIIQGTAVPTKDCSNEPTQLVCWNNITYNNKCEAEKAGAKPLEVALGAC